MLSKILRTLSEKPLSPETNLETVIDELNRRITPVLRACRDAINGAVGDETRIPIVGVFYEPLAGTSALYQGVDAMAPSVASQLTWVDDEYPAELNGRTRVVYVDIKGGLSGASTSVSFALYDYTAGAVVDGTELTTAAAADSLLAAFTPVDGHLYGGVRKRADGTGDALLLSAEIVVRYE